MQVYGSRLPGGTNLFRYSIAGGFPRDIVGSAGKVTGCTTIVAAAAPPGTYARTRVPVTVTGTGDSVIVTSRAPLDAGKFALPL